MVVYRQMEIVGPVCQDKSLGCDDESPGTGKRCTKRLRDHASAGL